MERNLHGGSMREILSIALVLAVAGFFVVTVMALSLALSKTINTETNATKNQIHSAMGLHVAQPNKMKTLPVELVPLP